ncbi:MAG: lipoprotein insertase outer membrane protein LolB [Salinisphaera sp.]|jgi:outer membrane lipoprotein LolB|nr:lipoprotein insertase outer membrane protein LolB [Salinisphaera sp.]
MRIRLFICVLGLLVGGCAIIRKPPTTEPGVVNAAAWQHRQGELAKFKSWSLQGRVATGQLLGWTGNLSWRQRDDQFDVRLAGPLGAGGMRAHGTLAHVTIDTDDGRHFVTNDPDALVERTLGWSFPLKPLRYWALGLPAPGGYKQISVNAKGRLKSVRQQGWRVAYLDYKTPPGAAVALPRRVVLDNGKTRIRLVIDRWFDLPGNG